MAIFTKIAKNINALAETEIERLKTQKKKHFKEQCGK